VSWADTPASSSPATTTNWRPGRPYLDGIEFRDHSEAATALRSVIAGGNDMAFSRRRGSSR